MVLNLKHRWWAVLVLPVLLGVAQAGPQRLSDAELSDVAGQAFLNLNTFSSGSVDYTRLNIGAQIDVQINAKTVRLGEYNRRNDNLADFVPYSSRADLDFSNLALGTVDDATGAVTPFSIKDPFVEFAFRDKRIVGLRMGMAESHGMFSGDLTTFSGNFNFRLQGSGRDLRQAACAAFLSCVGATLTTDPNQQYAADGESVNFDFNKGTVGNIRSTHVGLPNGTSMKILNSDGSTAPAGLLGAVTANNCSFLDMTVCFPNTVFESFQVGSARSPAKDVFISLQSQMVEWRDSNNQWLRTNPGVFFNVPKSLNEFGVLVPPIVINFIENQGTPRQNTCFGPLTKGC